MKEKKLINSGFFPEIRKIELSSIKDIAAAINKDKNEEDLYRMFKFIAQSHPAIKKMAFYIRDNNWNCKTSYGTVNDYSKINPLSDLYYLEDKKYLLSQKPFNEFDEVIFIQHKKGFCTYLFIGINDFYEKEDNVFNPYFFETLTSIIVIAAENRKFILKDEQQKKYKEDFKMASEVQKLLFPTYLPNEERIKIEATYSPHHSIGGDYYNYIPISADEFIICIADVSGKGIQAALVASSFHTSFTSLVRKGISIKNIVQELNKLLVINFKGKHHVTAFFLKFNMIDRRIDYINAGHLPPFLFYNDKMITLEEGSTIMGYLDDLPLNVGRIENISSCFFFAYTDGLIDICNDKNVRFEDYRLEKFLKENLNLDLKVLHSKITMEINNFREENIYKDDVTFLSFKYNSK